MDLEEIPDQYEIPHRDPSKPPTIVLVTKLKKEAHLTQIVTNIGLDLAIKFPPNYPWQPCVFTARTKDTNGDFKNFFEVTYNMYRKQIDNVQVSDKQENKYFKLKYMIDRDWSPAIHFVPILVRSAIDLFLNGP